MIQVDYSRYLHFYKLVLVALVVCTTTGLIAQVDDRTVINAVELTAPAADQIQLAQKFSDFKAIQLDAATIFQQVSDPGFNNEMEWNLGKEKINLFLIPHDIRHPDYKLQVLTDQGVQVLDPGPSYTYRGWNLDDPSHEVRLSITPDYVTGFITDSRGTEWFIQPGSDFGDSAQEYSILYRAQDALDPEERSCGTTTEHLSDDGGTGQGSAQENDHSRAAACEEVEVAIAADYSMYTKYGNNASNLAQHLLDVKNLMEPNYAVFDVEFKVVTTYIVTTSNGNPWSASTAPNTFLDSFCCWAGSGTSSQLNCTGSNGFGVTHDVGELWSNRDFDGSTVGVAWLGTICSGTFKYSVDQHFTTNLQSLRVLIAHEMGHNFGANHDASGTSFIMAPSVNGSATSFSSTSQTAISAKLPGYSCLSACSGGTGGGGDDCISTITVAQSSASGYKEAATMIQTSGTISLSATATYNAPNVQLNQGFSVANGTTFEIRSSGCD